jgi:hypothetical protein
MQGVQSKYEVTIPGIVTACELDVGLIPSKFVGGFFFTVEDPLSLFTTVYWGILYRGGNAERES